MEQPSRAALPSDSMDGSSRASLAPAASQDRLLDGRPLWLDELQEPPVPSKPGPAHSPWRALAKQAAGAGAAAVAATGTSAGAGTGGAPAAAVKDPQRGSPEARSRSASASTSLSGGDPAAGGGSSSRRGCFGTLGLRFVRLVRKMLVDSWKRADQSIFLLALALIVVPSALTVVYAVPFLRSDGFLWLCVLFGVLFGSTILLLFATSFTDPGFVPKNMDPPPSEINPTHSRVVTVNGKEVTVKYCNTCGSWRPPRTSHCAFCDRCVEGHDHHCPWMGTCVGHRNYRFFYFFLISVISLIAVSVAAHTLVIIRRPTTNIAQDNAASIAVIVLCGIVAWGVLLLNGYHTWLIAQGLSTHEQIRSGVSVFGSIQDHPNPYRRSTPWGNCAWALCRPIERSREFDVYLDVSHSTSPLQSMQMQHQYQMHQQQQRHSQQMLQQAPMNPASLSRNASGATLTSPQGAVTATHSPPSQPYHPFFPQHPPQARPPQTQSSAASPQARSAPTHTVVNIDARGPRG